MLKIPCRQPWLRVPHPLRQSRHLHMLPHASLQVCAFDPFNKRTRCHTASTFVGGCGQLFTSTRPTYS
jgi:hypothetical protein